MTKFSSSRKVINLIGSKVGQILLDKIRFLLTISCLRNECNFNKYDLSFMLQYTDDFNRINMTYNVNILNNINELKFNFWSFMSIYAIENEDILM